MISRRKMIQGMAAAGTLGFGLPSPNVFANGTTQKSKLKRVVFFMQNNGFNPDTCKPKEVKESCKLSEFKFAEHMKPLEPYKDKMQFITGFHGRHATPDHSSFFGALGGYQGSASTAPSAATIDHVISQHLSKTILPHLCIGWEALATMKAMPTAATLSASGAAKPIFMYSDPNKLYEMLFGSIAGGELGKNYYNRSSILKKIRSLEINAGKKLPQSELQRFSNYTGSLGELNLVREKLVDMSDTLKKYAPKYDKRYTNPQFETDWHDALLDIGIAALQSNITNVLTIGSGRAGFNGTWEGIGVKERNHPLGHVNQVESETWVKIRQYNCRMLIKLMKSLEAIPEGKGTMMDNTLIVYTSDCAEFQHSKGNEWPFVLLGNGGGQFKTGVYTKVNGRPINDLYTTFLRAIGKPVDHFNLNANMAMKFKSQAGPIESILV